MRTRELVWLIAFHPASIFWLTGAAAKSYQGFQCVIFNSRDESIRVLVREAEYDEFESQALHDQLLAWGPHHVPNPIDLLKKAALASGLNKGKIGLEIPDYYLSVPHYRQVVDLFGCAQIVDASSLVHDLRLVKSPAEIALIRQAAGIADGAMEAFAAQLRAGASELELTGVVHNHVMASGGDQLASPVNFCAAERSGFSHGRPTDRRLRPGDCGNIEFGAPYHCYPATIGRQFSIGPLKGRDAEILDVARTATKAAIDAMGPGVPAGEPFRAASAIIAKAGLSHGQVHTVGYCLAPAFPPATGERLHLAPNSRYALQAGMHLSVCPPIFVGREKRGARIVDNVLVTEDGVEVLSAFPREVIIG